MDQSNNDVAGHPAPLTPGPGGGIAGAQSVEESLTDLMNMSQDGTDADNMIGLGLSESRLVPVSGLGPQGMLLDEFHDVPDGVGNCCICDKSWQALSNT